MMGPMTTPRRRLPPEERRDQIVAAAGVLFAARPYEEVSTAEIAETCGVSRGLLNHYFPTRRDLYVAVVARLLGEPRFDAAVYVRGDTVEERIAQGVTGWVGMVVSGRETWLAASRFLGSSHDDDDLARIVGEYVDAMAEQICEIVGLRDEWDDPAVKAALHGYSAFATAVTRRWLNTGDLSRDQLEALLRETLTSLVRTSIPAIARRS